MVRAERAAHVLENEVFREAVEAVRNRCHSVFATSELEDHDARYHARVRLWLLEDLLTDLTSVMKTGQLAEMSKAQITEQRRMRDAEPGETPWQ